jgi:bacillithiol biosynthesis deacetylase BshB1
MKVDILTIAAHPDDVEITCGGTIIKMTEAGYRVAMLDLIAGETGTRGSAALREKEAKKAAKVLGVIHREVLGIPDAAVENNRENKLKVAQKIRDFRPDTVILPYWKGRHPDHYTTGLLGYEACFLAGLAKAPLAGKPHRPFKIIYATQYVPSLRPTFVVDITRQFAKKLKAIFCFASQFSPPKELQNLFPARGEINARMSTDAGHFGHMIGVRYGEPFIMREMAEVRDIVKIPVKSI